ncbi:MAG: rRNA maturation RNase YbeY [Coriobacteriia bacterium]
MELEARATSHRDPEPLDLAAFERLALFVMRLEEVPEDSELSIALVDREEIAHLNEEYRGVQGPTDVLSFGCDDPCPTPGDEPVTLGDVVIAPEVAMEQAEQAGVTVEARLDLLLVHGILHLLGYSHDDDESAQAMEARESAILEAWADQE